MLNEIVEINTYIIIEMLKIKKFIRIKNYYFEIIRERV